MTGQRLRHMEDSSQSSGSDEGARVLRRKRRQRQAAKGLLTVPREVFLHGFCASSAVFSVCDTIFFADLRLH